MNHLQNKQIINIKIHQNYGIVGITQATGTPASTETTLSTSSSDYMLDGDAGANGGAAIRNDETEYRAIPGGSDIGHLLFPHIQRLRPEKV